MKKAYVIVEGKSDEEILSRLLPENIINQIGFIAAGGRYDIQSFARSLLAVKRVPVAVVVDADTNDETLVQEKIDLIREMLHQVSPNIPFEVFVAVPEIETLFFSATGFIPSFAHQSYSPIELEFAKLQPKRFLHHMGIQGTVALLKILDNLAPQHIEEMRKHPLIAGLMNFLSSVIEPKNEPQHIGSELPQFQT